MKGVKEVVADWGQATPDLRTEVMDMAAEEDLVFVHWRGTATHQGKHQMTKHVRDIEPTGRRRDGVRHQSVPDRGGQVRRELALP